LRSLTGRVAVLAAAAVLAAGAGVAVADVTISSQPSADEYTQPVYTMDQGERAFFTNPSNTSHNVTAKLRGPDARPLFRSKTTSSGTTAVDGAQYLRTGTYDFFCTVHLGMTAKLQVSGQGTPVARPRIDVAIPRQRLGSVQRTGKLKARVKGVTASDNVVLIAKKGNRRLAVKRNIDLAAGSTRVVTLTLTRSGRKALKGLDRAAVSLRGSVPFGSPDQAARTLR
jgi:plastocyanin